MSTVIQHLGVLRAINARDAQAGHLPGDSRDFMLQATLLCSVHLDELEALAGGADLAGLAPIERVNAGVGHTLAQT